MPLPPSFGYLAMLYNGKWLPLTVLSSAAGHYIGTHDDQGPVSRESIEYFPNASVACRAIEHGDWRQRPLP